MNRYENNTYKRISKREAKKAFLQGITIYIVPCKVIASDTNPWITPISFNFNHVVSENNWTFENYVNNYEFYNCQYNQLGKYAAFYIAK